MRGTARNALQWVVNTLNALLPPTRMFAMKRGLFGATGVQIANGVKINGGTRIVGQGLVRFGSETWIGLDALIIAPHRASVIIGNKCDIGPKVLLNCGSHDIGTSMRRAGQGRADSIQIGDGVWLGAGATILGGAIVGDGCIVGCGAVVLPGRYPPNSLIAGNPAKVKKTYDE